VGILDRVKHALGIQTGNSDSLNEATGINLKLPVTLAEARLLAKLRTNRQTALESIPGEMKREFMSIYSDRALSRGVRETLRNQSLPNGEKRFEYLEMMISGSLDIKGFGRMLLLHHKIDPGEISAKMLHDIDLT
jgi:hypothetical protein